MFEHHDHPVGAVRGDRDRVRATRGVGSRAARRGVESLTLAGLIETDAEAIQTVCAFARRRGVVISCF
ncbi:MAG: hypothetical protein ACXWVD_15735 [Telluria sp.]